MRFVGNLTTWREILTFDIKKYIRNGGKCNYIPGKNTFFLTLGIVHNKSLVFHNHGKNSSKFKFRKLMPSFSANVRLHHIYFKIGFCFYVCDLQLLLTSRLQLIVQQRYKCCYILHAVNITFHTVNITITQLNIKTKLLQNTKYIQNMIPWQKLHLRRRESDILSDQTAFLLEASMDPQCQGDCWLCIVQT